jgi:UDP-N-acetylmuramoylalanine--D-glutamate ligase
MRDYSLPFKGKYITVLGLGLLGRGVGDVEFLAKCGAQVLVTDKKTGSELAPSVDKLKSYPNVRFALGRHEEADFIHSDMVVKAAGVPLHSPEIAAARAAGVPVMMSTALFAKYAAEAGATIVGVTGTRGKSTVSHMIFHALKVAGKRALLGGNVRGLSTLAMLPEVEAGDIAVLELDSWQLQGFGELGISPHVSVFTNLMPDHQNYYKSMDEYFADKANIFRYQKSGDTLIVGSGIDSHVRHANPPVEPLVPKSLPADWMLKVPGEHNRHNAALAASALLALGLNVEQIRAGLESFDGVEGRLQLIAEKNGVKIYNDNNATTPEATLAALKALNAEKKNIILIAGGSDKGLDMSELVGEIMHTCKTVLLLSGTGTDRIKSEIPDARIFDALKPAVEAAMAASTAGDTILFSPAFASFGMFKNEYERNDRFLESVAAQA